MTRASIAGLAVGALTMLMGPATVAQDEGAFDRTPTNCLQVISIDQTTAVDDQNIIFRMRGSKVYRNTLPRKCPGLERENRIAYKTYSGRLCSIDTITVLEETGFGLQRGFTCGLGKFVPLSPQEIEDLKRGRDDPPGQSAIQAEPIDIKRTAEPAEDAEPEPAEPAKTDE